MRIVIFFSKSIGRNFVQYLLDEFQDDEYTFVECPPYHSSSTTFFSRRDLQFHRMDSSDFGELFSCAEGEYDWLLNLWGGYVFKPEQIAKFRNTLNVHPSYLPWGRGRDPVVWSIRHNFPKGCTLHTINESVDGGDVFVRKLVNCEDTTTGGELYELIVRECNALFVENWADIRDGTIAPTSQTDLEPQETDWPTFRRYQLLTDQIIDCDEDDASNVVVRKLLAHDFSDQYRAVVNLSGKRYLAKIVLSELPNET